MSYRCGVGLGLRRLGLEPGPPRIKCDTCGTTREIGTDGRPPPAWFMNNKAVPGWKLQKDGDSRVDTCGRCLRDVGTLSGPPGGTRP